MMFGFVTGCPSSLNPTTPASASSPISESSCPRLPFVMQPIGNTRATPVSSDTRLMKSLGFPRRDPMELKRSAGIGIRFFMPMIGKLGFDMGYGFDDITGDGKAQGWEYTIIFGR